MKLGRILITLTALIGSLAMAYGIDKKLNQKEKIQFLERGLLMTEVYDRIGEPSSWYTYKDDKEKSSFLYNTWSGDCRIYFHRAKLVSSTCAKN